jgi:uncharacterized transporter YbjL
MSDVRRVHFSLGQHGGLIVTGMMLGLPNSFSTAGQERMAAEFLPGDMARLLLSLFLIICTISKLDLHAEEAFK